jgi:hypothetical protein
MRYIFAITLVAALWPNRAIPGPYDRELASLARIESNSGRNKRHPVVRRGIQRGDHAGGRYALMPNTVVYLLKISRQLRIRYGFLQFMPADRISDYLNNHEQADREIATYYWARLRKELSPERSALAWYAGPGMARNFSDFDAILVPYVGRFMAALQEQK